MPTLKERMSGYLRQLSFHSDSKQVFNNRTSFTSSRQDLVANYLLGNIDLNGRDSEKIYSGKCPEDLPNFQLAPNFESGAETICGSFTGPGRGLTAVQPIIKSAVTVVENDDIDFIDEVPPSSGGAPNSDQPTPMKIKVGGQEYHLQQQKQQQQQPIRKQQRQENTPLKLSSTSPVVRNDNDNRKDTEDSKWRSKWSRKTDMIYGHSDTLYDLNAMLPKRRNGHPIADCFGIIARRDSAIIACADGVNWGEKASLAARCAIYDCLKYLNFSIFNDSSVFTSGGGGAGCTIENGGVRCTADIFRALLRAFQQAHTSIVEHAAGLTTLTVLVCVPVVNVNTVQTRFACCACVVGDTWAYVYSTPQGSEGGRVRELTRASHDIRAMRDVRDALGALGPCDEHSNPDTSNLTLTLTHVNAGDILFVCTDGVCDNFDPVVCRLAQVSNTNSGGCGSAHAQTFRSKTALDLNVGRRQRRTGLTAPTTATNNNKVGPVERYELQTLLLQDALGHCGVGAVRKRAPVFLARDLCDRLLNVVFWVTSEKRRALETQAPPLATVTGESEKRLHRRRMLERVQHLPGKLDHCTVVAWNVGNAKYTPPNPPPVKVSDP